jgi:hypothetical protein
MVCTLTGGVCEDNNDYGRMLLAIVVAAAAAAGPSVAPDLSDLNVFVVEASLACEAATLPPACTVATRTMRGLIALETFETSNALTRVHRRKNSRSQYGASFTLRFVKSYSGTCLRIYFRHLEESSSMDPSPSSCT